MHHVIFYTNFAYIVLKMQWEYVQNMLLKIVKSQD